MKVINLGPHMEAIGEKLEAAGAKHAPLQRLAETQEPYGREVCLSDPPGIYYLLGTDNPHWRQALTQEVQMIFHGVPKDVGRFAVAIGYAVKNNDNLPTDKGGFVFAAILEPL